MGQSDIINDTRVLVAISDKGEAAGVRAMLENRGFGDIEEAENGLDMLLASESREFGALIADAGVGIIGLPDALSYITRENRYITTCVIADSWSEELRESYLGLTDVFATRPVEDRDFVPGLTLSVARKQHMRELEKEYKNSEQSFAEEKNMSFAKHLIMDKLGLSEEGAGDYILSAGKKYGYDGGGVAKIIYDVLLSGDKKK